MIRTPAETFHPGDHLAEEIAARGWTAEDLTLRCGLPPRVWREIIAGQRPVGILAAHRLSIALGTSAEFWLNLQTSYDAPPTPRG